MSGLQRIVRHPDRINDPHVRAHELASEALLGPARRSGRRLARRSTSPPVIPASRRPMRSPPTRRCCAGCATRPRRCRATWAPASRWRSTTRSAARRGRDRAGRGRRRRPRRAAPAPAQPGLRGPGRRRRRRAPRRAAGRAPGDAAGGRRRSPGASFRPPRRSRSTPSRWPGSAATPTARTSSPAPRSARSARGPTPTPAARSTAAPGRSARSTCARRRCSCRATGTRR